MRYDATRRDDYADYPDRRMGNGQRFGYDRSFSVPRNFSFRGRGVIRGPRYNRPMYGPPTQWSNEGYQNQPTRGTPRGRGILGAAPGQLSRRIFATDSGQSPMGLHVRNADVGDMNTPICAPPSIRIVEVAEGKAIF